MYVTFLKRRGFQIWHWRSSGDGKDKDMMDMDMADTDMVGMENVETVDMADMGMDIF